MVSDLVGGEQKWVLDPGDTVCDVNKNIIFAPRDLKPQ